MKILLTGSIAYDYLMTFPGKFQEQILPERLASISLSFLVDSMTRQRGGVAPNIAYTLALLGETPFLMGTVGQDFGDYRAWLEARGVDTSFVREIKDDFTASFFATTDSVNAQIASFYPGAMAYAAELSVLDADADLVVISPNAPDAMTKYAEECRAAKKSFLYDPGQQVARLDGDALASDMKGARFLFVNDYEFDLICKKTGKTMDSMRSEVEVLVITRGEKGASIYAEGREISIPIVPTDKIADPTGVGDAFRGGFLAGYARGFDWELCGQMGALAATYVLEQKGTQNHVYTREEFVSRFRRHFDDGGKLGVFLA